MRFVVEMNRSYLWTAALVLTLLCCIGSRLYLVPPYLAEGLNSYEGKPLLTTPDAYYYLRYAEEIAADVYESNPPLRSGGRPAIAPLLSLSVGSFFDDADTIRSVAFYLPPILSLGIVLVIFLFGREFDSIFFSVFTSIFTALAPIWLIRSSPGYFDTDPLNLFFFWFLIFACWKMISKSNVIFWGVMAVLCIIIFHFWWPQAGIPYSILAVCCCIPTFILSSQRKMLWIGLGVSACIAAVVMAYFRLLPIGVLHIFDSAAEHVLFLLGKKQSLFLPTAPTVMELVKISVPEMGADSAGHLYVLVSGIVGLLLFLKDRPKLALCFVVPGLVTGVMAWFLGARFLLFVVPAIGAGLAWLCCFTHKIFESRTRYSYVLASVLALVMLYPSFVHARDYRLLPYFTRNNAIFINELKKKSSQDALVWSAWGPAYFLQYYANRRTLIDGGIQDPEYVYIYSVALASPNPEFSANWMKLFAKHGNVIPELGRYLGSKPEAVSFLKDVLVDKRTAQAKLAKYKLPKNRDWIKWLFPIDAEVFISLGSDSLTRSSWLSQGRLDLKTGVIPERAVVFATPIEDFKFDRKSGKIILQGEVISSSMVFYATPTSLSHDIYREKGPVTLLIQGAPKVFTIPKEAFNALAFQLLFVRPTATAHFENVVYNPYVGGIWKVQ